VAVLLAGTVAILAAPAEVRLRRIRHQHVHDLRTPVRHEQAQSLEPDLQLGHRRSGNVPGFGQTCLGTAPAADDGWLRRPPESV
jgi:hypothetical protein